MCTCVCGSQRLMLGVFLFYASFEAECLIESEAYWSGWADWPESSKDPPVSALQIPPHTAFKRVLRI